MGAQYFFTLSFSHPLPTVVWIGEQAAKLPFLFCQSVPVIRRQGLEGPQEGRRGLQETARAGRPGGPMEWLPPFPLRWEKDEPWLTLAGLFGPVSPLKVAFGRVWQELALAHSREGVVCRNFLSFRFESYRASLYLESGTK